MNQNELYHFGIKGMHWGIRRFQNKDGTRTEAGKKRRKREPSEDHRRYREIRKKRVYEMSTKELLEYNKRRQAEQQYYKNRDTKLRTIVGIAAGATVAVNTANNWYNTANNAKGLYNKIKSSRPRKPGPTPKNVYNFEDYRRR